jgi:hypothetical protein
MRLPSYLISCPVRSPAALLCEARELSLFPFFGGRIVVATKSLQHIQVAAESLPLMYGAVRQCP